MIAKIVTAHETQQPAVPIWGTGKALREFLYVDDLAQALVFLMRNYQENRWINVGTGKDCTIAELAYLIAEIVGYQGQLAFDITKPDGTPRKVLDVSLITSLGWQAETSLRGGLEKTIAWYCQAPTTALKASKYEATL